MATPRRALPNMSNWERCVSDGHQRSSLIQEKHAVLFLKNLQTRRAKEKLKSTVTAERTCILDAYKPNKPKPQRESQPQRALHSLLISAVLSRGQKSLGLFILQITDTHVAHKAECQNYNSSISSVRETERWHWKPNRIPCFVHLLLILIMQR